MNIAKNLTLIASYLIFYFHAQVTWIPCVDKATTVVCVADLHHPYKPCFIALIYWSISHWFVSELGKDFKPSPSWATIVNILQLGSQIPSRHWKSELNLVHTEGSGSAQVQLRIFWAEPWAEPVWNAPLSNKTIHSIIYDLRTQNFNPLGDHSLLYLSLFYRIMWNVFILRAGGN